MDMVITIKSNCIACCTVRIFRLGMRLMSYIEEMVYTVELLHGHMMRGFQLRQFLYSWCLVYYGNIWAYAWFLGFFFFN